MQTIRLETSDMRAQREYKYAFIDSRHVLTNYKKLMSRWFPEEPEIDFSRVINPLGASRSFYYDCLDDLRRPGESETAYEARLEEQYAYLNRVRRARGCHIRLGALKGDKNRKEKRQKEIDVLIAVDMLTHAAQKNMKSAVLVTGDQDLKPAVESLVQLGVFVELRGDAMCTSRELTWAASAYEALRFDDYFQWSTIRLIHKYPIPTQPPDITEQPRTVSQVGKLGEHTVLLIKTTSPSEYAFRVQDGPRAGLLFAHNEEDRLKLYAEIVLGGINWNEKKQLGSVA